MIPRTTQTKKAARAGRLFLLEHINTVIPAQVDPKGRAVGVEIHNC
jgi:hypothetical protein